VKFVMENVVNAWRQEIAWTGHGHVDRGLDIANSGWQAVRLGRIRFTACSAVACERVGNTPNGAFAGESPPDGTD